MQFIVPLALLLLAELLQHRLDHVVNSIDAVFVHYWLPTLENSGRYSTEHSVACSTNLRASAEISSGPAVTVLPLGETQPAVGVAAVEGDWADKQLQTGRALQHRAQLAKYAKPCV